jgi:uncharacterized protein (TIGR03435 family)
MPRPPTLLIGGVLALQALAQSPAPATLKFEVASIRPGCTRGLITSPGRVTLNCINLKTLVSRAYDHYASGPFVIHMFEPIEGGPDWTDTELYDINAKAEGNPRPDLMNGPMMQALLEDRFKLKIHSETRQVPGYALTVVKGGPKLQPSVEGTCAPYVEDSAPPSGKHFCDRAWLTGNVIINFPGASMKTLAQDLSFRVGRPVVDQTGLTGRFDFRVEFSPDESTPTLHPPAVPNDAGTSIFTALQEQLRLKLEPAKEPLDVIVIDHVEQPSAN